MKIYVVRGTTGEYSDRNEWAVIAYRNEKEAQEFIKKAKKRAEEIFATGNYHFWDEKPEVNEFDPDGTTLKE